MRQLGAPIESCRRHCPRHDLRAARPSVAGRRFQRHRKRVLAWIADQHDKLAAVGEVRSHPRPQRRSLCRHRPRAWASGRRPHAPRARSPIWRSAIRAALAPTRISPPRMTPPPTRKSSAYKQAWRDRHPQIVQFWYGIDRAAIAAVARPGDCIRYGRLTLQCEPIGDASFCSSRCRAAAGCLIRFAKLITNRFDRPAVEFMDNVADQWRLDAMQPRPRRLWRAVDREHCFGHRPRSASGGDDAARSRQAIRWCCTCTTKSCASCPMAKAASKNSNAADRATAGVGRRLADRQQRCATARASPTIDAPVEHVPGAAELPPLKAKQKPAVRRWQMIGPDRRRAADHRSRL